MKAKKKPTPSLAPLVEAFKAWQEASARAQAVLDGVQREHAIVEAAKAQAAAIVEGPRQAYTAAIAAAAG